MANSRYHSCHFSYLRSNHTVGEMMDPVGEAFDLMCQWLFGVVGAIAFVIFVMSPTINWLNGHGFTLFW